MEKDSRLIDFYSAATAMQLQKYQEAFAANQFEHHSDVLEWLRVELRENIRRGCQKGTVYTGRPAVIINRYYSKRR